MKDCEKIKQQILQNHTDDSAFTVEEKLEANGYYYCIELNKRKTKIIKQIIELDDVDKSYDWLENKDLDELNSIYERKRKEIFMRDKTICSECNGSGEYFVNVGVPCSPEEAMWYDDGEFMCLGSESYPCDHCNGKGYL